MTIQSLRLRASTSLARRRRETYFGRVTRRGERRNCLFVSGPGGDARRYRCDHQAEQLALAGLRCDVGYHAELDLERLVPLYDWVVLYRVPWDERLERLLEVASLAQTRVVADVDDLVFDPAHVDLLRVLAEAPLETREDAAASFAALGRTLREADGVVVSTESLRDTLAGQAKAVAVAHNAVSQAMVEAGRKARARRRRGSGEVVIAYLSGTNTHDRDFLEAADAVLWTIERYPRVRFWAVGFLALDARFDRFGDRVVRLPYRRWDRVPALLAQVDLNLAPLEQGNAFTAAKSCLKYLEAAVVGVPTVASGAPDFARVIEPGQNGLLADGAEEWRGALAELVEARPLRESIGATARADVLEHHTTAARAERTAAAFRAAAGASG